MSHDELRSIWVRNLQQLTSLDFQEPLSSLPTLLDLGNALRRVPANKATGPDGIPGEFCHRNPAAIARSLYSQLLKLVLHGHEAFYRIVRPLALDVQMTDEEIAHMAARLNMADTTLQELRDHLQQPNAGSRAALPWYMRKYLAALHTDTHFAFRGQTDFCRTSIGTRPGDSFADVVFGYVWSRVLHNFETALADADLIETIPLCDTLDLAEESSFQSDHRRFLGPCWMDDLAVCLKSPTAMGLEAKAGQATGILLDLCLQHGMTPNVQPGKSELMLSFKGKGSRKLKERYYSPAGSSTMPIVCENATVPIHVVGEYLHLGALAHHSSSTICETKRRLGIGHQAFSTHRRLLYHNKQIPFEKRKQVFESLVLSKVLYGMELWTFKTRAGEQQFHSSILRLYRRLAKLPHDAHLREEDILCATELPAPSTLLRRQRLRYLVTLFQCGTVVPWGLLHSDLDWIDLLRDDLSWMYEQLQRTSHLPDPLLSFGPWRLLLREHPGYWKKLVTRAVKHDTLQRLRVQQVRQFHVRAINTLEFHGLLAPGLPKPRPKLPRAVFGCMRCQVPFRSKGGEGAHMNRSHQVVAEVRTLFDSTSCPACLKEYRSFSKVNAHLRSSANCRVLLQQRGLRCHPAPGPGSLMQVFNVDTTAAFLFYKEKDLNSHVPMEWLLLLRTPSCGMD